MAATKGSEPLLQSMEKDEKSPRKRRRVVVLGVVAACVVAIVGGLALRGSHGSSTGKAPPARAVPTTAPYNPRPGQGGTKVLTEPVDQLTVTVPSGWQSPAADASTLPGVIDGFAAQAPPLGALLQAESQVAAKAAVRLFAYQPSPPHSYLSVVSFSSPGATVPSQSAIDDIVAVAKKKSPNVAVRGVKLPVGQVIELVSTLVSQNQHVVVEALVLVAGGRTMQIQMAAETSSAGVPPLFDQIAQSLRLAV